MPVKICTIVRRIEGNRGMFTAPALYFGVIFQIFNQAFSHNISLGDQLDISTGNTV